MHRAALAIALCFELPSGQVPEAVELIPAPGADGRITGRDGRAWVWDAEAQRNVLDAYATRAVSLVIDRHHATQLRAENGEEAPAAAWVEKLELRDGALWGRVAWTPRGREQVLNREYRYLSPVFDFDPASGRIARLVSAGLTNTPNLHVQALNQETTMNTLSAAILAALGLAEGATEADALAAIAKMKGERDTALNNERQPSLDRFVPRADYNAVVARATNAEGQIAKIREDAHKAAVDGEIDAALKAGKITPASVDYHRASCSDEGGLQRFRDFVKGAPVIADNTSLGQRKPEQGSTALNAEEQRVIELTGVSKEDYLKARDARAAA
jgi:phage I-like protein